MGLGNFVLLVIAVCAAFVVSWAFGYMAGREDERKSMPANIKPNQGNQSKTGDAKIPHRSAGGGAGL